MPLPPPVRVHIGNSGGLVRHTRHAARLFSYSRRRPESNPVAHRCFSLPYSRSASVCCNFFEIEAMKTKYLSIQDHSSPTLAWPCRASCVLPARQGNVRHPSRPWPRSRPARHAASTCLALLHLATHTIPLTRRPSPGLAEHCVSPQT